MAPSGVRPSVRPPSSSTRTTLTQALCGGTRSTESRGCDARLVPHQARRATSTERRGCSGAAKVRRVPSTSSNQGSAPVKTAGRASCPRRAFPERHLRQHRLELPGHWGGVQPMGEAHRGCHGRCGRGRPSSPREGGGRNRNRPADHGCLADDEALPNCRDGFRRHRRLPRPMSRPPSTSSPTRFHRGLQGPPHQVLQDRPGRWTWAAYASRRQRFLL